MINSLKDKGFIDINIIYKKDSKQIEKRELIPIINNTNTYPTKVPYPSPAKVLYPMEQKVKDNKYNINNYKKNNKRNGNFEQRDYEKDGFDLDSLYANNKFAT